MIGKETLMSDEIKDIVNTELDAGTLEAIQSAAEPVAHAAETASETANETVAEAVSDTTASVETAAEPVVDMTDPDIVPEIVETVTEVAKEEAPEVATASPDVEAIPQEAPSAPAAPAVPIVRKPKKTTIGGQALIEGIMMCGPRRTAIAVRKADGSIYIEEIRKSTSETFFEKVPFVRGCIRFFRQLVSGTAAIMKSADISEQGAEEAPKAPAETPEDAVTDGLVSDKPKTIAEVKAEKKSAKNAGESKLDQWVDKHNDGVMVFAAILGLAFSIVLFILLPRLVVDTVLGFISADRSDSIWLNVGLNFIEGAIRIIIFLLYLAFTSKIKDIARVWMYHGAEHKTIACYEAGEPLTVENIKRFSRFHPRCGTAFLFIVVLVSILVFCLASVFIGVNVWWVNMLVRLALVPLVGGISFEILRFCGRHDKNRLCKIFIAPGLMLQRLTTKEPNDSMIEVAIAAVQAVIPEDDREDVW